MHPKDLVSSFLQMLLADDEKSALAWHEFFVSFSSVYDRFSLLLGKYVRNDDLLQFLQLLLIPVVRNGFKDEETKLRLFDVAQAMGVHILPVHYYTPVPNTTALPAGIWRHRFQQLPGWELNPTKQLDLLDRLAAVAEEMTDVTAEKNGFAEFFWNNPALGPMDAIVYYALIRELNPRLVLEVGGGYSTMVASKAALKNRNTKVWCIEPFPMEELQWGFPGLDRLIPLPVQEAPRSAFEDLRENDILFIDSTHVSKIGSDVNHLVFNVLPLLPPGVFIHFHDIFFPWEYPKSWVVDRKIFWNEAYLVLAFLLFNSSFEIVLSHNLLGEEYPEHLRRIFPFAPAVGGGSLWIRRRD